MIGVSTIAGAFDEAVVKRMAALNPRPVIMPLSNPTPLAECTFEQAVSWTNGEVVFASGSPFPPLRRAGGETLYPAQANNAYVFPALGHAAVLSNAREVSDDAFLDCAYELASMSTAECVATGRRRRFVGNPAMVSPRAHSVSRFVASRQSTSVRAMYVDVR